jgi:hypothetical protein
MPTSSPNCHHDQVDKASHVQPFSQPSYQHNLLLSVKMPVKWDEKTTSDLFLAILNVVGPSDYSQEQKGAIVMALKAQGYDVNWNSIR